MADRLSLLNPARLLRDDVGHMDAVPVVQVAALNRLASEVFEARALFLAEHDIGSAVRQVFFDAKCFARGGMIIEKLAWSYRDFFGQPQPVSMRIVPDATLFGITAASVADMGGVPIRARVTIGDLSLVFTSPAIFDADENFEDPLRFYVPPAASLRINPITDTGILTVSGQLREIPEGIFNV